MNIIKRPIITEKTLQGYKASKKVVFEVDVNTNKIEASKVLENVFGVKVLDAKVVNRLGKYKYDRKTRKLNKNKDRLSTSH